MIDLAELKTRLYQDGPDTPIELEAERAYREAFLQAAKEAGQWLEPDLEALDLAWDERRQTRTQAEIWVPSAEVFGCDWMESEQIRYRPGHEVAASRARGRVHGFEFVAQCFEALDDAGCDPRKIGPLVISPWVDHVVRWAERQIEPNKIHIPPQPDDLLTEAQRRMLLNIDPKQAQALIKRLTDVTREFLDWLWPGRIPLGKLTLLAGDPGLGKSFVTLDIASRVSRGAAWPDLPLFKTTPGGVILFNAEDDLADTICPRLDRMEADDTRIIAVQGVGGRDPKNDTEWQRSFSLETDLPRLEEMLIQFPDTRLVVIDPISAYTGGVDSHKNSDVRGLLAPLANLASQYHISVLSVTHLSKAMGSKAIYRAMGSLAFAAAARAVWTIVKDPDDPQRRLFLPAKLNLAQDPDGLAYRIKDGRVLWEPDPVKMHADDAFAEEAKSASGEKRNTDQQEAATWLRSFLADGPKPAAEILDEGDQYGFGKRMLQRALKSLGGVSAKSDFGKGWVWSLTGNLSRHDEGDKTPP